MPTKASISWSIKQICAAIENGVIVFDNAIQRNFVWNNDQMSLLVDSVLRGFSIPQFHTIRTNDKVKTKKGLVSVYDCIDGKQRCNTFYKFMHNEFALSGLEPLPFGDDEIDLNGKTYADLDEELQSDFNNYTLSMAYYSDITDEEVAEMMSRLNNGKPMTGIENARIKAKSLNSIIELAKHPFLMEVLSDKAIAGYGNEDIIMKSLLLMNGDSDLSSKNVRWAYENYDMNSELRKPQGENIWNALTLIGKAVEDMTERANEKVIKKKTVKKVTSKANFISIIYAVTHEGGVEPDDLADALTTFYGTDDGASIDQSYNDACTNGTMRSANVEARNEAFATFLHDYLSADTNS